MTPQGVRIHWGGEDIELRPERAAVLLRHETLLVADVHLGKARAFRSQGVPVPGGTTRDTIERLDALVCATGVRHIVFLGDLLHSHHVHGSAALVAFGRWRASRPRLALTLVRGNHDARAGDPPPSVGLELVTEPYPIGHVSLCHHPDPARASPGGFDMRRPPAPGERPRIAGHVHPCCSVHGRRDSLRLPCFHFGERLAVLPAFGPFTGMHAVERQEADAVWAIAGDRVVALPTPNAAAAAR